MGFRLTQFWLGVIAAAFTLATSAAHAFTIENKDEAGQYAVPKFNLEEQAKGFRKDGTGFTSDGKGAYEMPLGSGTLQFGVTQGPAFGSGLGFGGLGPATRNSRQDMDRLLAPPTSLEYNGVR